MKNTTIRYERHHKIPRSLGGTDDPDNIVIIRIEEHFGRHLTTALALREARIKGDKDQISLIDPTGEDPYGDVHWYGAAMIWQRMFGYERDRVRGGISDRDFRTLEYYMRRLDESQSNHSLRRKQKISDRIDDMFPDSSDRPVIRTYEMPKYREGDETRIRIHRPPTKKYHSLKYRYGHELDEGAAAFYSSYKRSHK